MKQNKLRTLYEKDMTKKILASLLSILIGLVVGSVIIAAVGFSNPELGASSVWDGIRIVFAGLFSTGRTASGVLTWGFNSTNFGNMLFCATPLIMTGLSVAVAFKTGLFNIGAPGQYLMGTLVSLCIALGIDKSVDLGFFGETFINKVYLATYVCILVFIILSILLYKTRFGLRLRACGENPQAADSLGINVYKMRYAGTTISGALAGMGGFVYALTTANCSSNGDVAGFGFLALAVMIFGNWKPLNIAGASLLFGLFKCIAAAYTSLDINGDGVYLLAQIGISAHFYQMLPYLITIIVLAFTSKSSRAPKAEGIPYDKGSR